MFFHSCCGAVILRLLPLRVCRTQTSLSPIFRAATLCDSGKDQA